MRDELLDRLDVKLLVSGTDTPPRVNARKAADGPVDRTLYGAILLLGVGSVLPTFVIFAAVDYFTLISPHLMAHISLAYNGTLVIAAFLNALSSMEKLGFTVRIVYGFIGIGCCMAALPVCEHFRMEGLLSESVFAAFVVLIMSCLGVADAFAQAPLYGVVSATCPPIYMQALMLGVALCGTTITLGRLLLKGVTQGSTFLSASIFFSVAAVYAFGSAGLYFRVRTRHRLFLSYLFDASQTSPTLMRRAYAKSPGPMRRPPSNLSFTGQVFDLLKTKEVLEVMMMLLLIHAQQFVVVPSIVGMAHDFIGDGWSPVLAILAYNVGELIGRGPLATCCCLEMSRIWPGIYIRCMIDAAICFCVPPYLLSTSPYPLLLLIGMLGASTGWLATSVMQQVGSRVSPSDRETTGYMSILAIFSGFIVGSGLVYPLTLVVRALPTPHYG